MTDPGIAAIQYIFRRLNIDRQWSVLEERGFTWWGKDFAQRVWSEPVRDDDGILVSRLHAKTDLIHEFHDSADNLSKLAALNMMASSSALVIDKHDGSRVQLAASTYVHDQN